MWRARAQSVFQHGERAHHPDQRLDGDYRDRREVLQAIIQVPGFDLNEIAYLSLFTDTIIGRSSGPHTFSQHMDNWLDSRKVNLSFTYAKTGSHFVLSDHLPMKKDWSSATNEEDVFNKICEVVGR